MTMRANRDDLLTEEGKAGRLTYRRSGTLNRYDPEGAIGLSPGFQPWEATTPKRSALKGRQNLVTMRARPGTTSRPFRANRCLDGSQG